jgi:serine/threonine protein kinase/TolB-like protein/Flp pilus assembly protein TadD
MDVGPELAVSGDAIMSRSTPTRDGRSAEILERALELTGEARAAYLEGACGADEALQAEIRSLLAAHDEAGEFMSAPTSPLGQADVTKAGPLTEGPGTVIGRYKILQAIGEGGFGAVYMAQQTEPVKRKVALKIIKLGMDTKQVIGRFEAERQALALMDHPNIAKVLDAGATGTGRPYFVMELVRGVPITEYCDSAGLGTEERLALFVQVCGAVQHAHQKGIIHRDIKPSNVLVTLHDGTPVPKVIDFGIAKATNQELTQRTVFTEFRQFLGTPEYMSPEQAEMSGLDVDTRTDIYSLGVLLYELLTGTTPFDPDTLRSAAYGEIQRIIREIEPPKPSTRVSTLGARSSVVAKCRDTEPAALRRIIRGDLDWIVMKALEKDRTRRYETANGLALDIRRYLANEPVLASPPRASYRLGKFVRRNRVVVTAGSAVVVALVAGITLASVALVQAKRDRDRYREAEIVAAQERDRAQLAEEKAKLLRRLFGAGTVSLAVLPLDNLSVNPGQEYFADGLTEALIHDLSRISALQVISPASIMRYKGTDKPLTEIARELDVDAILKGSVLCAGEGVRITAQLVHGATNQPLWADSYECRRQDVMAVQSALSRDVTAEIQLQLTPQDRAALASTSAVAPEAHEAYLKGIHALQRKNEEGATTALEFFDEAIRIDPSFALAHVGRADAFLVLENAYRPPLETMPRMEEAALKAIELDPNLAEAYVALSYVKLMFYWDWEAARQAVERALELNPRSASAHLARAGYLVALRQFEEALAELKRAEALDPISLVSAEEYGYVPYMAREYDLAIDYSRRAIELDPSYWQAYTWKGLALAEKELYAEAIDVLESALELDDAPQILQFLGGVYARAGYTDKAGEMLEELDRQSEDRFICPYEVAQIHLALGDFDTAFFWFDLAYELRSPCIPWLNVDPRLDPIRDDPRFADIQRRTGHEVTGPDASGGSI